MPDANAVSKRLEGLRVLSLQNRHAAEMVKLIENEGGVAISAPAMREVPLKENPAAAAFAEALFAGRFDLLICLTGVGARMLFDAVAAKFSREKLVEALCRVPVVARGPKVVAVLREFQVPIALLVPEPNTWKELIDSLDGHPLLAPVSGKRIALQEYGVTNPELVQALEERGAAVTRIPVYQWELPEDLAPLRRAVGEIVAGKIDVLLVTSAAQVDHLMKVAAQGGLEDSVRKELNRGIVVSVGPVSTQALGRLGIQVDLEPIHPKMGQLVHETAAKAKELLRQKRERS
jgi:uroporphyrinogen-III synthase